MRINLFSNNIIRFLILSLFFSAIVPFFANYDVSEVDLSRNLFGDKILICTDNGFEFIDVKDFAAVKSGLEKHKKFKCPLCYVAAKSTSFAAIDYVYEVVGSGVILQKLAINNSHISGRLLANSNYPRAPPFSI